MELNYLLSAKGFDTSKTRVLVMRHRPREPELRKSLPWLADKEPSVFNAFQQCQLPYAEKQLMQASYLVSLIGHAPKKAVFVGFYKITSYRPISYEEYWAMPANLELHRLGMAGWVDQDDPSSALWFDLDLEDTYAEWKGKLILDWPAPERSWTRWSDQNQFPVNAILEESALDKGMPDWNKLILTWEQLAHLPNSWIAALTQWRGVYFICDGEDGKAYIGSAYGDENLYGRWANYGASGDGGNKNLRNRRPDKFLFSILELVSPAMKAEDVMRLENNWKDRLHTREHGLNGN